MQSVDGKVILLTGGISGLGKVAAIKLASLGARVFDNLSR